MAENSDWSLQQLQPPASGFKVIASVALLFLFETGVRTFPSLPSIHSAIIMAMHPTSDIPDLEEDHDDAIDISLIMMNEAAMKMLDAEIDEVAEMASPNSPTSLSASSSVFDHGELLEEEREEDQDKEQFQSASKIVAEKTYDDDGNGDDDSFMEELSALNNVAKQIEEELREETADSMKEAMQRIMNSPAPKKKSIPLESEDREIIDRILDEETKKYAPKNKAEEFMSTIRVQGLSARETTLVLSSLCAFVWTIAFGLMRKVLYAEIY